MAESNRNALEEMEFPVEVWLAAESIPLGRLIELQAGEALELTKDPDAPVDLVINGITVARGELVVVDGRFGLRITGADETTSETETGATEPATRSPDADLATQTAESGEQTS